MDDILTFDDLKAIYDKIDHGFRFTGISADHIDPCHAAFKGFRESGTYFIGILCDDHTVPESGAGNKR